MAIPAYLWLKDVGGANIRGSVDVHGRSLVAYTVREEKARQGLLRQVVSL